MARDETKRITPGVLQADRDGFAALQAVPGYNPSNPEYSLAALRAAQTEMSGAQLVEAQAAAALASARDTAAAKEWAFHNLMLGAKEQVIAQFGKDSNEVQALGLKKVSEYKRRGPRSSPPPTEAPKP